jgi:hypothetical protein
VVRLVVVSVPFRFIFIDESTGFCFLRRAYWCTIAYRGHIEGTSRARRGHIEGTSRALEQEKIRDFSFHMRQKVDSLFLFSGHFFLFSLFPLVDRVPDVYWCTIVYRGALEQEKIRDFSFHMRQKVDSLFLFSGHFFLFPLFPLSRQSSRRILVYKCISRSTRARLLPHATRGELFRLVRSAVESVSSDRI